MGTVASAAVRVGPGGELPGYWLVFRAVFVALIAGAMCLWAIGVALSLSGVVGLGSGDSFAPYAPWVVDGPWSLAAAVGWGALVAG